MRTTNTDEGAKADSYDNSLPYQNDNDTDKDITVVNKLTYDHRKRILKASAEDEQSSHSAIPQFTAKQVLDCNDATTSKKPPIADISSNADTIRYGNLLDGKNSEAQYRNEYRNVPPALLERMMAYGDRTLYSANTTKGEGAKVKHQNIWEWTRSGTSKEDESAERRDEEHCSGPNES